MKKITKQKLIYIRYILPPILMLLILLVMLIPSYRYVAEGNVNETISFFSLLKNSYNQSRDILFGEGEQTAANMAFSKALLSIVIIFPILYLVAMAAAIYNMFVAMRYFIGDDEEKNEITRTVFITFFPNRIFLCIVESLILPFLFFPYIMTLLYKVMFNMRVSVILTFPDALIIGGISLLVIFALSVICAPMERELEADIFRKRKDFEPQENIEKAELEDDYKPMFKKDTEYDEESEARKERIRKLLGNKKED